MDKTINEIADIAELSCFYVMSDGLWLRIDYTDLDEGYIGCHNEDSGDEYAINFTDIKKTGGKFFQLVEVE
jgi:hypothetical protein